MGEKINSYKITQRGNTDLRHQGETIIYDIQEWHEEVRIIRSPRKRPSVNTNTSN